MWGDLLLDLLLAALVITLSPIPIIAITLVLSTPRGRANGLAFSGGWVVGLLVITAVFTLLTDGVEDKVGGTNTIVELIRLSVGVLLLVLATRKWMKRPKQGEEAELPPWMSSIEGIAPNRALVLGLTLAAANPKNLAFALVAGAAIASSGAAEWIAVLVFVLLGSLSVLGSVVFYLAATDKAASGLANLKDFMARHNAVIMAALFAFFGIKMVLGSLTMLMAG
ncbi:MAG: GAP family protein [Anaerolineae bacterium]